LSISQSPHFRLFGFLQRNRCLCEGKMEKDQESKRIVRSNAAENLEPMLLMSFWSVGCQLSCREEVDEAIKDCEEETHTRAFLIFLWSFSSFFLLSARVVSRVSI